MFYKFSKVISWSIFMKTNKFHELISLQPINYKFSHMSDVLIISRDALLDFNFHLRVKTTFGAFLCIKIYPKITTKYFLRGTLIIFWCFHFARQCERFYHWNVALKHFFMCENQFFFSTSNDGLIIFEFHEYFNEINYFSSACVNNLTVF